MASAEVLESTATIVQSLVLLVVCDHGFMQLATSRALYLVFAVTNADSSKDWEGVIVGWVKWHDGWSWQI